MPLSSIVTMQASWAKARWPHLSGRRAPSLAANLFAPLCDATHEEFAAASGNELGLRGRAPKMDSLRSSSALACNVFDPWRDSDLTPLGTALRLQLPVLAMRFEQQFPHGLRGIPPNLDVVLNHPNNHVTGVECKFAEPYGPKRSYPSLDQKYFIGGRRRWSELGLSKCQELAEAIGRSLLFKRLDAGQLIKHVLGLAVSAASPVRLRYLWYDTGCTEAREQRAEISLFRTSIDTAIDFDAVTYQELFAHLGTCPEPKPKYVTYLRERYFGA